MILPDVNVLIALVWPNHLFHQVARTRMERERGKWATCVVTQLGFVRLSSNAAVLPTAVSARQAVDFLTELTTDRNHVFIEGGSPTSHRSGIWDKVRGPKQVADAWLLSIARRHDATLVTFDSKLSDLARNEAKVELLRAS